ncbi:CARDB domain-containing protein [Kineococcus sp. SYSU DK005]|uniref:CARDB domain-containing protein n=1 Tax=Kineococcus sp. SYSU DK005 TaxID=3383126 RepID=UPI003D7DE1A7
MGTKSSRSARGVGRLAGAAAVLGMLGAGAGAAPAVAAPALPDLVVTGVSPALGSYMQGSQVLFEATVRNVGRAAKEPGQVVGVAFVVDGRVVTWSDDTTAGIAPGESITVRATAGPTGARTWAVTPGRHSVRAWVDDVDRVREADERNNVLEQEVAVARSTARAVTGVTARAAADPARYRATHDRGVRVSWSVPAGQPAGTTYTVLEHPAAGDGAYCSRPVDLTRVTTTASSVVLPQSVPSACSVRGDLRTSTFSVVATPPGRAPVESAHTGTCENAVISSSSGTSADGVHGPVTRWWLRCADGAPLEDAGMVAGTPTAVVDAGSASDTGYTGGQPFTATGGALTGDLATSRWGWSRYSLPVPAGAAGQGRYRVQLLLAEPTWSRPGQRVFGLTVEGVQVRERLDLAAEVGRDGVAVVEAFVDVTDGAVTVDATSIVDNPIVASLAVHRVRTPV